MEKEQKFSIWFFVGLLLTVYGIIILIASILSIFYPVPETHVVLEGLHADIWWGGVLLLSGIIFLIPNWPWRKTSLPGEK